MNAQAYATQNSIKMGATVHGLGRTPSKYRITQVDDKGFQLERATGKMLRISWKMVERTLARLQAGEKVLFQGNISAGGIDGTSAKRDGVLAALQGLALRDGNMVILAEGAAKRIAQAS